MMKVHELFFIIFIFGFIVSFDLIFGIGDSLNVVSCFC